MLMKIALRPPETRDYEAIASWIPDAAACERWAGTRLAFPFSSGTLQSLLEVPGGKSHSLATEDSCAIGFGQHWMTTPGTTHLGRIIVSPLVRGQGLGNRLLEQLIAHAVAARTIHSVTLRVYRDNSAALALYRHFGFEIVRSDSTESVYFMRKNTA